MSYNKTSEPLVSIIIPTKDNVSILKKCLSGVETKSTYKNYEIIIVDNNSKKIETKSYLSGLQHRVISYNEPFNFSKINNFAVTKAVGEFVIFLNDDTEVISPDWIEQMLKHSQKPEVGAVGAKLLYSDNTVHHAGILMGVGTLTAHAFEGFDRDYQDQADIHRVHECSAVTGACMMIRKRLYEEVGGFDEHLPYAYNDVDLCLRLRENGYTIIYTPYAELYHYTQSTRSYVVSDGEIRYFVDRWRDLILQGDPYYDPNLSRVIPYTRKRKEERFVLTDLGLFEKSEPKTLRKFKRYKWVANNIVKQHGIRRLTLEFLRYLTIKVQRK